VKACARLSTLPATRCGQAAARSSSPPHRFHRKSPTQPAAPPQCHHYALSSLQPHPPGDVGPTSSSRSTNHHSVDPAARTPAGTSSGCQPRPRLQFRPPLAITARRRQNQRLPATTSNRHHLCTTRQPSPLPTPTRRPQPPALSAPAAAASAVVLLRPPRLHRAVAGSGPGAAESEDEGHRRCRGSPPASRPPTVRRSRPSRSAEGRRGATPPPSPQVARPFRRPAQAAAQRKRGPESGAAAAKVWPPRRPRERDGSGSARGTSSFENREEISVPR
jgi:hypothetical protein